MAEARLHGDEVIRQRKQQKSPGEQACCPDPSLERQSQSQQAGEAEEAVIQLSKILDPRRTIQRMARSPRKSRSASVTALQSASDGPRYRPSPPRRAA